MQFSLVMHDVDKAPTYLYQMWLRVTEVEWHKYGDTDELKVIEIKGEKYRILERTSLYMHWLFPEQMILSIKIKKQ